MSLGWVIAGTFGQLVLGLLLFMVVAISGGAIGNGNALNKLHVGILNFSIIALPLSCVLSAGIVLYLYNTGASSSSYWWYSLPLILTALYVLFALSLSS